MNPNRLSLAYRLPSTWIAVYIPPPHLQVELAEARRELRRYEDMAADIRSQLQDVAQGRCSPEVALLTIAQIIQDEVKP